MASSIEILTTRRNGSESTITLTPASKSDGTVIFASSTRKKPADTTTTVVLPVTTARVWKTLTTSVTDTHVELATKSVTEVVTKTVTKLITAMTVVAFKDPASYSSIPNDGPRFTPLPALSSTDRHAPTVVNFDRTSFTMTKPTQTFGNAVFVADPLNKYRMYDPYNYAVAPTGSCDHGGDSSGQQCRLDGCMWNFMKPMNISTVMPAVFYNEGAQRDTAYITHVTELRYPHWGTSTTGGLYYPTSQEYFIASGTPTTQVYRATPEGHLPDRDSIHGKPTCYDLDSCHSFCSKQADTFPHEFSTILYVLLWPLLAGILALLALIFCIKCCRNRKQQDPTTRRTSTMDKLRRKSSTKPEVVVVNQVTGAAQDPATGQAVDPSQATGVLAGSAAGAEAGREEKKVETADDGKGTTARRAEEGRGRVNFEDGGRPGNDPPQGSEVVRKESATGGPPAQTTEKVETTPVPSSPPPQQIEMVESKPAPAPGQTDGTSELSTGVHFYDTGSMRGRKRARPETDGNRLNLAFWGR